MTTDAISSSLSNIFDKINQDFVESLEFKVLGNGDSSLTYGSFSNFFVDIFNKDTTYSSTSSYVKSIDVASITNAYVRSRTTVSTSNYTDVPMNSFITDIYNNVGSGLNKVMDINITHWADAQTQQFLTGLYLWHDLCHDGKWTQFKNNQTVELRNGRIDGGTRENETVNVKKNETSESLSLLKSIFDPEKLTNVPVQNMFMVQRLFYVYIRMTQFSLAMYVNNGKNNDQYFRSIPASFINIMQTDIALLDDVIQKLNKYITDRKGKYNDSLTGINTIHDDLDDYKTNIKLSMDRINSEAVYEKRTKNIMIASFAILVVVLVGAMVTYVLPMERRMKMIGSGAVLAIATLTGLILVIIQSKTVVEGFDAASAFSNDKFTTPVNDTISWSILRSLYINEMRSLVSKYLEKCYLFAHLMNISQTLGNAVSTIEKETRYFNDANERMMLAGNKMKNVYRNSDLVQKQYTSSMYFFITIGIIISVTLTAYLAFESLPGVQSFIMIGAGIVLLLAIIIYVLEYSGYVRTDGDKKYWGQPPNPGSMIAL